MHQADLIDRAKAKNDKVALDEAVGTLCEAMQRTRLSAQSSKRKSPNKRKREPSEDVLWQGIRASCEAYKNSADQVNRDKHVAQLMRLFKPPGSPAASKRRSPQRKHVAKQAQAATKKLHSRDGAKPQQATKKCEGVVGGRRTGTQAENPFAAAAVKAPTACRATRSSARLVKPQSSAS